MKHVSILLFCVFFFVTTGTGGAEFKFPKKLPPHPRLFLTSQRETEIKERMKSDEHLDRQVKELLRKADKAKKDSVSKYEIPDGKRLLAQSRRSLERTSVLAFAYRMTGQTDYAEAAIQEMLTVCRFKDWNPSHYLDTAEMATAVGIGYDWLYDIIPVKERDEIRDAMVRHAMQTGLGIYEKNRWWASGHNNWNEVCNAGLTVGALAIADEERELAEKIVGFAIQSIPSGLRVYQPDGAYPEGPIYWSYGASFTGLMFMALKDVFQDDFGILKTKGLDVTGDYYAGMVGPLYLNYNYADGSESPDPTPMMYALAQCFNRPDYAVWLKEFVTKKDKYQSGRLAVFRAIWYPKTEKNADFTKMPLAKKYRGIQDIATMRTAWNEPNAAFAGFKAGNNQASHGHLDIGSFVYDVDGERWAVDLGPDNYNMPGYFGKQRWDYYRLNNRSHNTLLIGDKIQNPKADCKIIEFETDQNGFVARAVADITDAYPGQVKSAKRTLTLQKDGSLVIEDRLEGVVETVRWGMMTRAQVELKGKTATLSQGKKTITARIESPQVEQFDFVSATPPQSIEAQNKGFSMLAAFAKPKNGTVSIKVVLSK